MNNAGQLIAADLYLTAMPTPQELSDACEAAIAAAGMTVVDRIEHHFEPHGLTAVWILAESHLALHTYPEHNYLSVDVYTCGTAGQPAAAVLHLQRVLPVEASLIHRAARGAPRHTLNAGNAQ